jgi:hypothetical protein
MPTDGLFDQLIESITNGKIGLDVNLRWENAKIDLRDRSNALTIRTRLGYGTRPLHGFRLSLSSKMSPRRLRGAISMESKAAMTDRR